MMAGPSRTIGAGVRKAPPGLSWDRGTVIEVPPLLGRSLRETPTPLMDGAALELGKWYTFVEFYEPENQPTIDVFNAVCKALAQRIADIEIVNVVVVSGVIRITFTPRKNPLFVALMVPAIVAVLGATLVAWKLAGNARIVEAVAQATETVADGVATGAAVGGSVMGITLAVVAVGAVGFVAYRGLRNV